ncbi:hypothetical protein [Flagellimonas onchidii]|uniref:hypothetical protein n=1 Tax=Flagellimonas onchidii TaxID=2562684 RepID=UPI0010A62F97|nr:hypothetical protein [Allomuricauda onchidii]
MNKILIVLILGLVTLSCSKNKIEKKGFQVNEITEDESGQKIVGLQIDSLKLETQPKSVLLTFNDAHRLTPIYKVNYDKKTKKPWTGSIGYHNSWDYDPEEGNNWNRNFMPGFEAIYGYNFVNVSHYNNETKTENKLFKKPVLIKNLYYPAFSKDTLNYEAPVKREFYMVSVYDEDTNKDGFINVKDLRRFYHFNINGLDKKAFIPQDYSALSSEYDWANDYMYVFAKKDTNQNGQAESNEPTEIFWIDLKNPENFGKHYNAK